MEKIINCELCGNNTFEEYLKSQDYFLTNQGFTIVKCRNCGLLFVNPRPSATEIAAYYKSENYISHSTKQQGWMDKIYALVRKKNHQKKFKLISNYKRTGSILDIGCATGEFLDFFKKKGWKVTGVEPNEDARNFAEQNFQINVFAEINDITIEKNMPLKDKNGNVFAIFGNIFEVQKISEQDKEIYDVITMWHVLEHVHNINERVAQIYRILKNDGLAVIAVPNFKSNDASFYKEFWAGYDLPRHLFHFSENTITALFEKNGFGFVEKIPLRYDAFYISLISEKYKTGKKNLITAFYHGLKSNILAQKNNNEFSSMIYIFKKTA